MRPLTWTTTHGDTVEVYEAEDGPRYRVQARNGAVVEQSSEAYSSTSAAIDAALRHHPRLDPLTADEVDTLQKALDGVRAAMVAQAEDALREDAAGGES